jgi:DNA polymerase IV
MSGSRSVAEPILHVDLDAFYASVEVLKDPSLAGKPVVVGGGGTRGVVMSASYEARVFGIRSAMPAVRARRLCPEVVFVQPDFESYKAHSNRFRETLLAVTPLVEPISLDEAFLDVRQARRLHGPAPAIAAQIRQRVLDEEGLTCSVGVAPSKFVAKLASEAAKPRISVHGPVPGLGVKVVGPDEVLGFLHPLPVQALWGVGPATLQRLERLGITTVGDLAAMPTGVLTGSLGAAAGHHLHALANGVDDRAVEPDRRPKSIGHEETFAQDHHRHDTLERELVRLSDSVGTRLRSNGVAGRTVTLKVRFRDFHTITRSTTLSGATDSAQTIVHEAKALLAAIDPSPGVRLIGVSVSGLTGGGARQLTLDAVDAGSWDDANLAVDAIRARFGTTSIGPATLAGPGGLRLRRTGEQQWGPGSGQVPQGEDGE